MEKWFSKAIITWYQENKRDLPWRHEKDAYKIWLSEIILQQTQVAQGLSYYLKFVNKYPSIKHLAKAPEDEVLKLWQGLGYYSRARNLHASAKMILNTYAGVFPQKHSEIKNLKGVGTYTAAAIASFAYDLPHAVVDGNVYRVLSRVFGIKTPIDSSAAKSKFQDLADQLLDKKNPAIHNQAIMEFGSQFCKPNNPDCNACILNSRCFAFKTKIVSELPIKTKKAKIRKRYFNYLVLADKNKDVLIRKRQAGDIWQGLYEFKLQESEMETSQEQLFESAEFKSIVTSKFGLKYVSKQYKHILSHQHLFAKFYVISVSKKFTKSNKPKLDTNQFTPINLKQLKAFAFPRLTGKFLEDCDLKEIL
ncbi:A/G-specific adenine glycosylase [Aurantibacillus circumpalustris]|uniref:A/G-specific adenine glycosylase n=1 Tax=Aurantibacillus circumpalustris TaxID=3036359 RepID=UPI00295A9900|nr:A/G-specific adenine glycosylase [Aurantibacillus circumpalustris]